MSQPQPSLNYSAAGVNIDAGMELVQRISPMAQATTRTEVLGNLGGFGGMFELSLQAYQNPVLVSSTDGVGTKLKLATLLKKHDTIGIDLVAMCVNDIVVSGAEPLFFLDYYATGQLDVAAATEVIQGIATGCQQSNCSLIGGETAEMPGMYAKGDYDLAGFAVGIVEKSSILGKTKVTPNSRILALASSGPHSNGYSLIRKIIDLTNPNLNQPLIPNGPLLSDLLLTPTRIYVKSLLTVIKELEIQALAHITGGGLTDNIPRILPDNTKAVINLDSWQMPYIFRWLQSSGNIDPAEMLRTFNCGVGMVAIVPESVSEQVSTRLTALGEQVWDIGWIESTSITSPLVEFRNILG
ncbi:phosphoribosylaminoimidazole synthetase [Achromatium sp. WMS2]|nr:phosphoribosylaminoimidazole synthetase [Achromatium sp. WMS2]